MKNISRNKNVIKINNVRSKKGRKRVKLVKHVSVKKKSVIPLDTHVKQVEKITAAPKKVTNLRTELGDGCYMVTYYYRRGLYGELLAEDIDHATHFERVIYDRMNHMLGTTTGELGDKISW